VKCLAITLLVFGVVLPSVAAQEKPLADPVDAFVLGYDPSNGDFFIHEPERAVLLRLRLDFNNDGIMDLAVSEGSIRGQAGGPWLIFLGDRDGRYTYAGELFFYPTTFAVRPVTPGTAEVTTFERMSASGGRVAIYRISQAGITLIREYALEDVPGADRERYRALFPPPGPQAESCRLMDYRRDKPHCWRPGVRLE
jgi:hypothetical protein